MRILLILFFGVLLAWPQAGAQKSEYVCDLPIPSSRVSKKQKNVYKVRRFNNETYCEGLYPETNNILDVGFQLVGYQVQGAGYQENNATVDLEILGASGQPVHSIIQASEVELAKYRRDQKIASYTGPIKWHLGVVSDPRVTIPPDHLIALACGTTCGGRVEIYYPTRIGPAINNNDSEFTLYLRVGAATRTIHIRPEGEEFSVVEIDQISSRGIVPVNIEPFAGIREFDVVISEPGGKHVSAQIISLSGYAE